MSEEFAEIDRLNTAKKFADWLWQMLFLLYRSPYSKEVQDFWLLNNRQGCPSLTLAHIYEKYVPEGKRSMFCQAIGELLHRHIKETGAPEEIFEDLIYLISKIEAFDLLGELSLAVKNRLAGKKSSEILYSTLAVLLGFTPRREAYEAASLLINCDGFDDGYLFVAIRILVECKPAQAKRIIAELKPRIVNRYQLACDRKQSVNFWETIDDIFPEKNYANFKRMLSRCFS